MDRRCGWAGTALLALSVFASACATPVAISTASPRAIHRYLTQNALSADEPSTFSEIELRRYDLLELFADDPDAALVRAPRAGARTGAAGRGAVRAGRAVVPARRGFARPGALRRRGARTHGRSCSPKSRASRSIGWTRAAASRRISTTALSLRPSSASRAARWFRARGASPCPSGTSRRSPVRLPTSAATRSTRLDPVAELVVVGLRNRYRRPGIGAPLAATLAPTPASAAQPVPMTPSTHLPLTAVIDVERPLAQIRSGQVTGRLELLSTLDVDTIEIGGRSVAARGRAHRCARGGAHRIPVLAAGADGLLRRPGRRERSGGDLRAAPLPRRPHPRRVRARHRVEPRALGRHGERPDRGRSGCATASRSGSSATTRATPSRTRRWQLRQALTQGGGARGSGRRGPCLRDMVVMGHSQGGLLTKMTAIDVGDRFWRQDQRRAARGHEALGRDARRCCARCCSCEPLPFVRRVIFLATPHRGSYLAGPQLVRRLAQRLVRLPSDVVEAGADLATAGPTRRLLAAGSDADEHRQHVARPPLHQGARRGGRSVPTVTAHSIIAVTTTSRSRSRRRRGEVRERPHRGRGIGAGGAKPALGHAGRAGDRRGGAPHPARALGDVGLPGAHTPAARHWVKAVWHRGTCRASPRGRTLGLASARAPRAVRPVTCARAW